DATEFKTGKDAVSGRPAAGLLFSPPMPRRMRRCPGGLAYHVMNRSAGRVRVFEDAGDYDAFERVLAEAATRERMRVCAWCVMPNHFHLVLWPERDDQVSSFMRW